MDQNQNTWKDFFKLKTNRENLVKKQVLVCRETILLKQLLKTSLKDIRLNALSGDIS